MDAHVRFTAGLGAAYCITAAVESGLLGALLEHGPLVDVAQTTGLDADGVQRVLQVLETSGWVHRVDGAWDAAPWVREAQTIGLPLKLTFEVFAHVGQLLRDGSTMMRGEVRHDSTGVQGLATMFADAADRLARLLPMGTGTVLDVGAGSAVWSLAMAGGEGRVVALDRPEVLQAAERRAVANGQRSQLELLPGSFWEVDLPSVDRVLIANVVHLLDDATSRELVNRTASALKPGGELVVVDVIGREPFDAATAAYHLHLRLREPLGMVHTEQAMTQWLTDAGLSNVRTYVLGGALNLGAVIGTR